MSTISELQSNVATSQANLQQANIDLAHANANLAAAERAGSSTTAAQAAVDDATTNQTIAQAQLTTDQSALDVALSASNQTAPSDSSVAPADAQATTTTDSSNNVTTTDYSTPSSSQLTSEATSKVTSTGLAGSVTNITQGVKVVTANGSASAVNAATGETESDMGSVSSGNTVSANSLPSSSSDNTTSFKAILTQEPTITGDDAGNTVLFYVMPTIAENRDANYKSFTPTQHPGEILKYEGTNSRTWGITTKLVAETVDEADRNLRYMNLIRSWVMPFYGTGTGTEGTQTSQYLGAPPPVLTFKAYGEKMIGPVKCVLLQYNWTWPNDVDYIRTSEGKPFPVMIDISLNIKESYSPAEYSSFNLLQYRNGNLSSAFGGTLSSQSSSSGSSTSNNTGTSTNPTAVDTSSSSSITQSQATSANSTANSASSSASAGTSTQLTSNQTQGSQAVQKALGGS